MASTWIKILCVAVMVAALSGTSSALPFGGDCKSILNFLPSVRIRCDKILKVDNKAPSLSSENDRNGVRIKDIQFEKVRFDRSCGRVSRRGNDITISSNEVEVRVTAKPVISGKRVGKRLKARGSFTGLKITADANPSGPSCIVNPTCSVRFSGKVKVTGSVTETQRKEIVDHFNAEISEQACEHILDKIDGLMKDPSAALDLISFG